MTGAPVRFLVVAEDLLTAQDLKSQIKRLGYDVEAIASNSEQAVRLVGQHRPDIVLMDMQQSREPAGLEAAGQILDAFGIPSILITAGTDANTLERAQCVQPLGYLVKPVEPAELHAALLVGVAQYRFRRTLSESVNWLRALIACAPGDAIPADRSAATRFINKAAKLLTGTPVSEYAGHSFGDEFRLRDEVADNGGANGPRGVVTGANEQETPPEYTAFERGTGHQIPPERIIVVRDRSERVRVERLLEAERDRLETKVANTSAELDKTKQQLRALAANLMHAQEEERRSIARNLHDDLAQQLAYMEMKSDTLENASLSETQLRSEVGDLRSLLNSLSDQVRTLSHQLHPSTLDHLGLPIALESLARDFGERNPDVLVRVFVPQDAPVLRSDVAIGVYRIASEALRNVEKHACTPAVSVRLYHRNGRLRMVVRDYGRGFDVNAAGFGPGLGLISMRERSLALGGKLKTYSKPGYGTLVVLTLSYGS